MPHRIGRWNRHAVRVMSLLQRKVSSSSTQPSWQGWYQRDGKAAISFRGVDGAGRRSLESGHFMDSLDVRFDDAFLEGAVAELKLPRGAWADLFLERVATVRVEWDARQGVRRTPGLREGF